MIDTKLKIEQRLLSKLTPSPTNPNTHGEAQIEQIIASMKEFGWTMPLLIDERGVILAGHGRVLAAQKIGLTHAPVLISTGWSEAKKRAYIVADNQLSRNSDWDNLKLAEEIEFLKAEGFDLSLTALSDADMARLFVSAENLNPTGEYNRGMPEFDQPHNMSFRQIVMHFNSHKDANDFAALIKQPITDKTKFLWFPAKPKDRSMTDKRYSAIAKPDTKKVMKNFSKFHKKRSIEERKTKKKNK